jgi:hypothetical protein
LSYRIFQISIYLFKFFIEIAFYSEEVYKPCPKITSFIIFSFDVQSSNKYSNKTGGPLRFRLNMPQIAGYLEKKQLDAKNGNVIRKNNALIKFKKENRKLLSWILHFFINILISCHYRTFLWRQNTFHNYVSSTKIYTIFSSRMCLPNIHGSDSIPLYRYFNQSCNGINHSHALCEWQWLTWGSEHNY